MAAYGNVLERYGSEAVCNRVRQDGSPDATLLHEITSLEFGDAPIDFLRASFRSSCRGG